MKKNDLINFDKLHPRELYDVLICTSPHEPIFQVYFESIFFEQQLNWIKSYILSQKVSLDYNVRSFQYKLLNNVLYLKKAFYFWKIVFCLLCILQATR